MECRIASYFQKLGFEDLTIDRNDNDIATSLFFADFLTNCFVEKISNDKVSFYIMELYIHYYHFLVIAIIKSNSGTA